jgi:hypothetical protein
MAILSYAEMRKIDVSPFVEKRDGNDYLNWAMCKELLHQNGAEKVYFEPCTNANGSSLFMSDEVFTDTKGNTNRCYEVRVHIVIDDLEFDAQFPLMNGSNPVKDNSLTQQRLWNAQTRAFVKGVAIHTGLGFNLWINSEEDKPNTTEDDLSKHSLKAIKQRFQEEYTKLMMAGMSVKEIADAVGMTEDLVKAHFTYFDMLDSFEGKLKAVKR